MRLLVPIFPITLDLILFLVALLVLLMILLVLYCNVTYRHVNQGLAIAGRGSIHGLVYIFGFVIASNCACVVDYALELGDGS